MKQQKQKRFGVFQVVAGVAGFLSTVIGLYAVFNYALGGISGFLEFKQNFSPHTLWSFMLVVHAIGGGVALSTGWLQFVQRFRTNHPGLHRRVGLLFLGSAFAGALSGLYIAFYANGGPAAQIGFIFLSLLWLFTLGQVLTKIKIQDFASHERWAWRMYALTFAAVTLRLYNAVVAIAFGPELIAVFYPWVAWLCWVPNIIFIELYLVKKSSSQIRGWAFSKP